LFSYGREKWERTECRTEKEKRKYLCDECDYVSGQSGNLKRHKKTIHEEAAGPQPLHRDGLLAAFL
jgi:hypothetical protein